MAVSENGKLSFSKDGGRLFFGMPRARRPSPRTRPSRSRSTSGTGRTRSPAHAEGPGRRGEEEQPKGVVHFGKEKKFVQLATPTCRPSPCRTTPSSPSASPTFPTGSSSPGTGTTSDYYLVSLADGSRKKVLEKSPYGALISPGRAVSPVFQRRRQNYYAYRIADGRLST